jgi:hypothetical protein
MKGELEFACVGVSGFVSSETCVYSNDPKAHLLNNALEQNSRI